MRLKLRQPAPTGSRFGPSAFDGVIGDVVELRGLSYPVEGRVVGVEVLEDGAFAVIELEFPDIEIPRHRDT